jgi:hypothetical protein
MFKRFLILALVALPFLAASQSSELNYPNQFKLSAFRPLNILNPGVEISYERFHNNKLSTQFSAGMAANVIGKPFHKLHGYNLGLEEKYFLWERRHARKYISLALNHSAIKYQEITTGPDTTTNLKINDSFTVSKKTASLAFKYGIQFYDKHFVVDINIGAGVKYRSVKHFDRQFEYIGPREPFDLFRAASIEKQGITFCLPLNVQLGYRF